VRPLVLALLACAACAPPRSGQVAGELETPDPQIVDLDGEALLRGRFAVGGRPAAGWTVALRSPRGAAVPQVTLDAEGRFALVSRSAGQAELTLLPEPLTGLVFIARLELVPGENAWALDVPVGRLEGRVAPGAVDPQGWLVASWRADALEFRASFEPQDDGSYVLDSAPAGAIEVQHFDSWFFRPFATVEVRAGQTTRRDLP
jgi:hypothetical protein